MLQQINSLSYNLVTYRRHKQLYQPIIQAIHRPCRPCYDSYKCNNKAESIQGQNRHIIRRSLKVRLCPRDSALISRSSFFTQQSMNPLAYINTK